MVCAQSCSVCRITATAYCHGSQMTTKTSRRVRTGALFVERGSKLSLCFSVSHVVLQMGARRPQRVGPVQDPARAPLTPTRKGIAQRDIAASLTTSIFVALRALRAINNGGVCIAPLFKQKTSQRHSNKLKEATTHGSLRFCATSSKTSDTKNARVPKTRFPLNKTTFCPNTSAEQRSNTEKQCGVAEQ